MANFTGMLRSNEIFASIFNMIISQEVFADNVKGTYSSLEETGRVDGGLYGDTKLYYATDVLKSHEWGNDSEAQNLLALDRPEDPKCQAIFIDQFRQIRVTVDNYLTKQAWQAEGAFSSFNSVVLGWIRDTKKIYDSTMYNAFVGTVKTTIGKQSMTVTPVEGQNDALTMAEALASLLVDLKDVSRDYNDYGFMRSYDEGDLMVVWNAKVYNTLKKIDMPVIFHKEGLLNEFDQEVLPAKYFGTLVGNTAENFTIPAEGTNTYRTLVEIDADDAHLFPGEKIPAGAVVKKNETYMEDGSIAFKVIHKRSIPYMSAFEVGTSFFNPRSLTENHYLTFGHNTLTYLKNYPCITATFAE